MTSKTAGTTEFPQWPVIEEDEIQAACSVLRSGRINYWTGREAKEFEREFAQYLGARHCVAVANGTLALELALRVLGIQAGDEVIVPCRTFVATASAVLICGAKPVFCDVDPLSGNICVEELEPLCSKRTKAIVVVHVSGWPCEMDSIVQFASANSLHIIEDCAQAHGARYRAKAVGTLGTIGAYSFCQDKIMTTGGEGGMLAASTDGIWKQLWSLKDHGKDYDKAANGGSGSCFRWLHDHLGTNARMTEVQAAMGRVALRKLDARVDARRRNGALYDRLLSSVPGLQILTPPQHCFHSYYRYYVNLLPEALRAGWDRQRIMAEMTEQGLPCFAGICCEVYREKVFAGRGLGPEQPLPHAQALAQSAVMLPVYSTLEPEHIADIAEGFARVMRRAVR